MRVSAKADYALRALIEMAAGDGKAPISAEELGRRQDIPHGFLQAILADLRRAGIGVGLRDVQLYATATAARDRRGHSGWPVPIR